MTHAGTEPRTRSWWHRAAGTGARAFVTAVGWLTTLALTFSVLAVLAVLGVVTADALARHLAGGSVKGAIEWAEVLLVIAVFMGLAPAQRRGSNVATTIVLDRAHGALRIVLRLVGFACGAGFAAWLGMASIDQALDSVAAHEVLYGLARVPVWPARLAVALGAFLLLAQVIADALETAVTGVAPALGERGDLDD